MSSENDAKAKALEKKLAEDDAENEVAGKVFDPKLLFERANTLKTVDDPVLGKLQYGELTLEDSFELTGLTSKDRVLKVAYLMLRKAYPEVTEEMVWKIPLKEGDALLDIVLQQPIFLSVKASCSKSGSKTTKKHKK
jgi:hypothetical protein